MVHQLARIDGTLGHRTRLYEPYSHHAVDVIRGHAETDGSMSGIEDLTRHPAHYPHPLDLLWGPADNCICSRPI